MLGGVHLLGLAAPEARVNARTLVARLRRHPTLTRLPVCPVCGLERQPSAFTAAGRCRPCEAQLALDYEARMRGPDGSTHYPDDDYRSKDNVPF